MTNLNIGNIGHLFFSYKHTINQSTDNQSKYVHFSKDQDLEQRLATSTNNIYFFYGTHLLYSFYTHSSRTT